MILELFPSKSTDKTMSFGSNLLCLFLNKYFGPYLAKSAHIEPFQIELDRIKPNWATSKK